MPYTETLIVTEPSTDLPVATLSDEAVMALSRVQMDKGQGERLGQLLEQQREHGLTADEQHSLMTLMQVYHQLWIRQSEALAEAIKRGLRPPLE